MECLESLPDPQALVEQAVALSRRLSESMAEHVHPGWHAAPGADVMRALPPLTAFRAVCGELPPMHGLGTIAASWCLLPAAELRARLGALALCAQPGVLRACIRRAPRHALEALLGPAFDRLLEISSRGPAIASAIAEQDPGHWVWLGYSELSRARLWPSRSMRRWARLALGPAASSVPRAQGPRPPGFDARSTLGRIEQVQSWFAQRAIAAPAPATSTAEHPN